MAEMKRQSIPRRTGKCKLEKNVPLPVTTYEIETNIPVPGPIKREYPFAKLKVGESFLEPEGTDGLPLRDLQNRLLCCARRYKRSSKTAAKKDFTTRTVPAGIRCWRIK